MSEAQAQEQGKERGTLPDCPLCAMQEISRRWRQKYPAFEHFHNAHMEVLKGMRALLDECIKKGEQEPKADEPRVTKIEVE